VELEILNMPQRIPQGETAVLQVHIPGLLQDGFTVGGACEHAVNHVGVGQII
jgi:hypothetical protein